MKKVFFVAVPALLVLAGIALLVGVAMENREASRSDHWTQAVGTIEKAVVEPGGVALAYKYEFDGIEHRNPRGTKRDAAGRDALLARYVAGSAVLVYVNPAKGAESVLELPPRPPAWPMLAGPVLIILGLALAVVFLRYQKSQSPPTAKTPPTAKPPPARKAAPPLSRLRPPPPIKRP